MAINACSINAFTINGARCRTPNLFRPAPVVGIIGTNNRNVSNDFARQYPHLIRHSEHEVPQPHLEFEQPYITVSAELMGETGSQTLEAKVQMEFVSVTDIQFSEGSVAPDITVNISDISI